MSFFQRQDNHEVPPVDNLSSFGNVNVGRSAPTGGSTAYNPFNTITYNASRDGPNQYGGRSSPSNFYSAPKSSSNIHESDNNSDHDRYGRSAGVGGLYSGIGDRSAGADRFTDRAGGGAAGINANPWGSWRDRQPQNQEAGEDYVDMMIGKDIRAIGQGSISSSRNALRMTREAEETTRNVLSKLGDQSENGERHLDVAKANAARDGDRTSELKQLNNSTFRPVITLKTEGKRRNKGGPSAQHHPQERDERENAPKGVREPQQRTRQAVIYGHSADDNDLYGEGTGGYGYGRPNLDQAQQDSRVQARSRFQPGETASDDESKDELDDGLDEIRNATKRLLALAAAQGEELDRQKERLEGMAGSTTNAALDDKLKRVRDRLNRS